MRSVGPTPSERNGTKQCIYLKKSEVTPHKNKWSLKLQDADAETVILQVKTKKLLTLMYFNHCKIINSIQLLLVA